MTRYDLFRKRLAPIAFVLALGLLVREQCTGKQRIHGVVVITTGEAEAKVKAIDAQVVVDGEVMGELHRNALSGSMIGDARFNVTLPAEDAFLKLEVEMVGETRHLTRRLHVEEGATVSVDLSSDLR